MNNPYHAPAADLSLQQNHAGTYDPQLFAVNGRIGRLRYLAYSMVMGLLMFVVMMVVAGVAGVVMAVTKSTTGMMVVMFLAYVPVFAVTFIMGKRRLNDMGHSGWLSLLLIVPVVGFFVWLWLMIGAGNPDTNKFGPPPSESSTLVIVGACIMPFLAVVIIGILAAVAIPAYQQYQIKAQVAKEALSAPQPAPVQYPQ